MRRRRTEGETADLFAAADATKRVPPGVGHADATGNRRLSVVRAVHEPTRSESEGERVPPTPLIDSPLVDDTRNLLENRVTTLGSLLSSERAVEYVACLRAFVDFRERHEPEPLHEDLETAVCGEDASPAARAAFKSDIRQLKDWGLVEERIEKERLRGYRDTRRTKFRYRLCDDAAAFVEWLKDRRAHDLDPSAGDETGNLLDIQRSLLAELRRMLRKVSPGLVDYDAASDILYRADRMGRNVAATAKTLQELNLRLLAFGVAEFGADEAKMVVQELGAFLERFGRRFGVMREDIMRDVVELRRDCHAARWRACAEKLQEEASRFRHIATMKIPDAAALLADAEDFYGAGGKLVGLMARVGESARKVWGKLNAKLRELERRNHRLEDIGARLAELARLGEDEVPHEWLQRLVEAANMRGDAQVRPGGEKSAVPKPKTSTSTAERRTPGWIRPRKVGERPDVASIAKVNAERLKEWMVARGVYPEGDSAALLSAGAYGEFNDFRNVVSVIEHVCLGSGEKGRTMLGIRGGWTRDVARVEIDGAEMAFDDLMLSRSSE